MNADAVIRRNNVRVLGRPDGPVLVLVQGFGCDQVVWDPILPEFTDTHRVVLLDHVGTGGADPEAYDPLRYASLEAYLADLMEVLEVLDLQDATIVGHSIAGMMGLSAATRTPRIGRLVLLGGTARYLNDDGYVGGFEPAEAEELLRSVDANYPLWVAAVAPGVVGKEPGSGLSSYFADRLCRLHPDYVRDFLQMSLAADVRHLLPRVQVPALVLQTRDDPLSPASASNYLFEHLPAGTRTMLAVRGNLPHLSAPHLTAQAVHDFLKTERHA
ncbi:alpha/beta hydrolase [Arthrobacter sp. zg-Y1143]|uniref:alpha/beta fold hydrolase n=1 Tax=Arthrobacter sp. zg-Y1143 TaxID=3049065 RepID=UPI0024C44F0C|nr:alpha/beta hydrolase [Arthrobacter sp. zg-Y1143]MDK1326422.1 alpha/beta hydrolase [Arthrobacter sp. zg-Y1143]